ncbi:vasopressin V2 receptor [Neoarius graeffei]|uniref:vasopressin V2 receptor n=1 Tax=Neoarius graeffei TaxID=443677 RepID=UPI00298CFA10|nr:vasopressin V2 receptor [Neoarius graeffei]
METDAEEPGWHGPDRTMPAWNSSSAPFRENSGLNSSYGGGYYFWLLQNSSAVTTNAPLAARVRDMALAQVEIGVLSLVLALTTLSNSFVLWVLLRRRKHNAPMHLFMVNLCVADLVVAFFQVLPQLVWDITEKFQGPDALCRSVKYMQIVGMFASSYMIVAMTVDRHYAICCPLQAYRLGAVSRWNTPIMVAWGLSLVLSVPQVFIFSRSEVAPGEFECWGHFAEPWGLKAYVTWMTLAVFILPTFIITVCQVRIFREIHDNIYLKSKRVVSTDSKKNVIFRMPSLRNQKDKTREKERGRGSVSRDSRRGFHRRNKSDSSQSYCNACNSQHALQPDCCNGPFQDSQGGNELQYNTQSPDVLPHTLSHTHSPINQSNSAPHMRSGPLPEGTADCYRTSLDYCEPCAKSFEAPAEICNPVPPIRVSSSISRPVTSPPPGVSRAMSKTLRMTLVIVLVYTMCWSPFFTVQLWAAWDPNPPDHGVAFTILMLLASLNSCTNPWIYTAFSSSISHELVSLLHCRPRITHRGSLPEDSSAIHTTSTTKDYPF